MVKSLADLRAATPARPERSLTVVVGEGVRYVARIQELQDELEDVVTRMTGDGSPRKMGEGLPPEVDRLRDQIAEQARLMGEYEGTILLRATRSDGEWRRWCNEHPPRDEGKPARARDVELTGWSDGTRSMARCNADDLIDDLATYVVEWEGERLEDGDFARLGIAGPDCKQIARMVVDMYENEVLDVPKWRRGLSGMRPSVGSSVSPSGSESPASGSSAGSPESATSTTTPTGT